MSADTTSEAVVRWLLPIVPLVLGVVVWTAFHSDPGPDSVPVAIALGGFVLVGVGVVATLHRRGPVHLAFVVALLVASVVLMWLQPDGVAFAGIFVGLSLLAPLTPARQSIPLTVGTLLLLGIAGVVGGHGSVVTSILNAVLLASFYGMTFLAMRYGEAKRHAEQLVVELNESRAAEARAAGMAERQRLAREMHDVLAHSLSGLLLQLEAARMLLAEDPTDPRLPGVVDRAHQLGRTGLDEARRAIGMLRDDELPGPERLPGLAAQFQQDRDIPTRFTVSGQERELASEARLALYRVAQEALTNITRHARPVRVELHLAYEPSATRLVVEDFATTDTAPAPAGDGYGLTGMRERAELLGGTLTTDATPRGFRVELDVPA